MTSFRFFLFFTFLVSLSFICTAFGGQSCSFYIASNGTLGNWTATNCTSDLPCLTLQQVSDLLNDTETFNCSSATIYVSDGVYPNENSFFGNITSLKSLTIRNEEKGTNATFTCTTRVVEFVGVDYSVRISGLNFQGPSEKNFQVSEGGLVAFKVCTGDLTVESSTFTNGRSSGDGGAIFFQTTGKVNLATCKFVGNVAQHGSGGAIYVYDGNKELFISQTYIDSNSAGLNGGGLFSPGGNVIDSNFWSNFASNGGGIYSYAGYRQFTLLNSNFTLNSAIQGGGVWLYIPIRAEVNDSVFKHNVASKEGGGIFFSRTTAIILKSTIFNNTADNGAGIYASALGNQDVNKSITVLSSDLHNNFASAYGGGVYCNNSIVSYNTTSIKFNYDGYQHGGEGLAYDNVYCDDFCLGYGTCQRCECSECSDCPFPSACALAQHDDGDVCTCYVSIETHHSACEAPLTSSSFPSSPWSSSSEQSSKAGVIVGVIFAVLIVTGIISGIAYFYYRRRQNAGYTRILLDENSTLSHPL